MPFGLTTLHGFVSAPPSLAPTFLKLDIPGALSLGVTTVVLTFFLVDVLDNAGTLIATTQRAGLMRPDGTVPRLREALLADSGGAIIGAVLGTSTTTSYIESAAGIQAGGRTGLTAVTVAVLFLLTLFFAPIATAIPSFATAPALVFVACLMARGVARRRLGRCHRIRAGRGGRHRHSVHLLDRHRHRPRVRRLCRGEAGGGTRGRDRRRCVADRRTVGAEVRARRLTELAGGMHLGRWVSLRSTYPTICRRIDASTPTPTSALARARQSAVQQPAARTDDDQSGGADRGVLPVAGLQVGQRQAGELRRHDVQLAPRPVPN